MTKEKRNENLTVIGIVTYLIIILFASVIIASKIGTIGDYSDLIEKSTNITSLEEIIQKANSVEISDNVVTAIYQEKSKELEVSYSLNTYEIIKLQKFGLFFGKKLSVKLQQVTYQKIF